MDGVDATSNTNEESDTVDQVTSKNYNFVSVEELATK